MAKNKINFEIGFTTNLKNLNQMKSELAEIRKLTQSTSFSLPADQVGNVLKSANNLEHAMTAAFNPKLNTVNVQKFNNILKQSGTNLAEIQKNFSTLGAVGNKAFAQGVSNLMSFNNAAKQTNEFLENIGTSIGNTIRWSLISSAINTISGGIQQSYYYIKDLDSALNDIRIVTGKSADEMSKFAEEANNAAKSLAVTTEDYTQGSLIYYQQGLDDETVKALTEITAKTSNVTGQSMGAVSEELTAVWNGYKVANEAAKEGMQVYEEYVDKMAAVGASTASDLQELSTAMSKVASAASAMGVDFDDLNAQIATIVSVTRQAPESVGTALKTIYARLGDLKVDGVDEFGVKLGEITGQLQTMGIQILDSNGDMRNMSSVMAEVAEKWNTWTSAQRQAAAVAMAGKRQYNNLVALFDNWDMYGEALQTSMEAAGTLEEQQEIALDSLSNKMDQLKATAEDLYDSLYDEEDIKNLIEGLTYLVQGLADFSDSIGGLVTLLPMLGSTAMRVFSNQIAEGLNTIIVNTQNAIAGQKEMQANYANLQLEFPKIDLSGPGKEIGDLKQFYDTMYQYRNVLSSTEQEQYNAIKQSKVEIIGLNEGLQESLDLLKTMDNGWNLINKDIIKSNDSTKENVIELTKQLNAINSFSAELKTVLENGISEKDTALSVVKKLGLKDLGPEVFKNVKDQITLLNGESKKTEEILTIILNKFQEIGKQGSKVNDATNEINRLTYASEQARIELEKIVKQKFDISNIVNVTGAFGQLASSINTIKNLGSIWTDEDITLSSRLLQTTMNLSFVLPALISSFSKLNTAMFASRNAMQSLIAKEIELNIAKNTEVKIEKLLENYLNGTRKNAAYRERVKLKLQEILATKDLTEEQLKQIIVEQNLGKNQEKFLYEALALKNKKNAAEKLEILQSKQLTIEQIKLAMAVKSGKVVLDEENAAREQKLALLVLEKAALVAVATAAVAVVAGIALVNAIEEKERKNIIENNKAKLEEIKANQEIINQNEKLVKSYNELYKEYLNNKEVKKDLYEKTLEVAEAYDIEGAKVLALGNQYDILTQKIKAAREEEIKENIQAAQNAQTLAGQNALEELRKGIGGGVKIKNTYYDPQEYYEQGKNVGKNVLISFIKNQLPPLLSQGMSDAVNAFGIYKGLTSGKETAADSFSGLNSNISIDFNDSEAVLNYEKQLEEANRYFLSVGGKENDEYYQKNEEKLKVIKEYTNEIVQQKKIEFQNDANLLVLESNLENLEKNKLTTLTQYKDELFKIRERLIDNYGVEEKEVDNYIKKAVSGSEKISVAFEKIQFTNKIAKDDKDFNNIINLFEGYSDSQVAYIIGHINTDYMTKDLEDWKKEHAEAIEIEGIVDVKTSLQGAIQSRYKSGEGFTDDTIKSLFQNEQISNLLKTITGNEKLNEDIFKRIDATEQLTIVTQAYIQTANEAYNISNKTNFTPSFDWDEVNDNYEEAKVKIEQYSNSIDQLHDIILQSPYKNEIEQVEKAIVKYQQNGNELKKLTKEEQIYINYLLRQEQYTEGMLDLLGKTIPKYYEGKNAIETYEHEMSLATQGTHDFDIEQQSLKQDIIDTNKAIDDLQSHFKTLVDIMSDYNETGHFTIDNAQKIVELDTQYAASLEFVGDKLQINEEYYKNTILAKVQELRLTVQEQYEQKLLALQLMDTTSAQAELAKMTAAANAELQRTPEAARAAVIGYEKVAKEIRSKFNLGDNPAKKALADLYEQEYINKNKVLNDIEDETNKGGYNFRRAMGAQTQADKDKDKQLKKTDKEKKREEDEINRYWEIEKALEKIADALKKVDKLKSHVFGKQKIQVLQQEAALIKQQTQLYEKLYEEQKKEAEELKAKLSAGGTIFSAEGEVLNYGAALKGALATYNKAVDDFNAGLIDDQAFKIAEDNYQKFKKDMDRYDKLFYSEMKDTREKIEEEAQKLRDIALEEFEIKIQVKIDKAQLRKDFRNFRKELQKDFTLEYEVLPKTRDFRQNFKDDKSQVNTYMQEAQIIQKEIDTIMAGGSSKMFASLSEAQEKLKKVNQDFQDASKRTMQDVEDAWDNYIAKIDQANQRIEDQEKRLERVNTQLESFRQIAELAFGSKAYEQFGRIFEQQLYNNQAQIEIAMKETETYQKLFEKQIEIEGANRNDMSTWSEAATKYYNQWKDKEQEINDLTAERLKLLKDDYLNTLDQINDSLEKQLTTITTLDENGHEITVSVGFDIAEQEWELAEKQADLFYNSTEKAYQMQSLSNKIQQDIDKSSLASQKKLQAFRDEQLFAMNKEDVLTKDQVAAAQAKYDILLKQIALEEARNNKTSMKLTRNAEGNWSYQYVADDSDVQQKQQDLLDSWEKLRSLSQDQMNEAAKNLRTYQKMANDAAVENEKKFAEGLISKEQYEYTKQMIEERYYKEPTGILYVLGKNYQESKNNLILGEIGVRQEVYDQDKDHYIKFTEEEKAILDGFREHTKGDFLEIEKAVAENYSNIQTETEKRMGEQGSTYVLWNTATTKMADAWTNNKTGVKAKITKALKDMEKATSDYKKEVEKTVTQVGLDWESMKSKIEGTKTETDLAKKAVIDYCKTISRQLPKAAQQVQNLMTAWERVKDKISDASIEIEEYLKKQQDIKTPSAPDNLGTGGYNGGDNSNNISNNNNQENLDKTPSTSRKPIYSYLYVQSSGDLSGEYNAYDAAGALQAIGTSESLKKTFPGTKFVWKTDQYGMYDSRGFKTNKPVLLHKAFTQAFKTGGYTGSWTGNEGRLATLHQKELVLNAKDTENFLAATDSLRKLTSLDASIEKSIASAISKMLINMAAVNNGANSITTSNNESNTNNIFNINAEFPNANDVNEIREAILSLPSLASQYIHRTGY